jgi:DNA-binding MarR family transcriptional regulator
MPSAPATATSFEDAVAAFFRAARRARGRASQRTEPGSLSLAQFYLLEPLLGGSRTLGQLADTVEIAPPTASRMLEALRGHGLVERTRAEDDRRSVRFTLTDAGRAAAHEKRDAVRAARRRMADALSEDERVVAADLLVRLAAVIEEL